MVLLEGWNVIDELSSTLLTVGNGWDNCVFWGKGGMVYKQLYWQFASNIPICTMDMNCSARLTWSGTTTITAIGKLVWQAFKMDQA